MKIKLDNRPLYQRAEEALSQLLETCSPGDQLPPEPALAQSLGISRATLREALRNLERKRVITRRQGVGTFYNGPQVLIDSGLETLVSVDTLALRQGLSCSMADLEIHSASARQEFAEPLGLEPGQPVTIVRRTKVSGERPIAYMVDVLPQSIATPEQVREGFSGSVLDFLVAQPDLRPAHATANILPRRAGKRLGRLLHVAPSTVLLLLEETVYTGENVRLSYSRNYFVPQYFKFHLVRQVPM
jgi:GntR family transcriptional regulator